MKSSLSQLTDAERQTLALLYNKPDFKALTKLINIERLELAKDAIEQKDIGEVRYLHGQSVALQKLLGTLRSNFKDDNKQV
jgi:hypothetical protein